MVSGFILPGDLWQAFDTDQFGRARRPAQSNCLRPFVHAVRTQIILCCGESMGDVTGAPTASSCSLHGTAKFHSHTRRTAGMQATQLHITLSQDGGKMPFVTNAALPASVRDHLPAHAQDIYRSNAVDPVDRLHYLVAADALRYLHAGCRALEQSVALGPVCPEAVARVDCIRVEGRATACGAAGHGKHGGTENACEKEAVHQLLHRLYLADRAGSRDCGDCGTPSRLTIALPRRHRPSCRPGSCPRRLSFSGCPSGMPYRRSRLPDNPENPRY